MQQERVKGLPLKRFRASDGLTSRQQQNHLLVAAQRYGAAVPRPCFSP